MKYQLAFLLLITLLHSTTITGSTYSSDSFDKINGTLLKFDGASHQQVFAQFGDYSIQLEPGEYNVTAVHMENGSIDYFARENLTVGSENQLLDLVIFPPEFFDTDELPNLNLDLPAQKQSSPIIPIAVLALIAIVAALIILKKYPRLSVQAKEGLGEDEKKVLRLLEENEGRMEQKALREILKFSETKMSLLLTELEVSGSIRRFKKGRENIVKLKKV